VSRPGPATRRVDLDLPQALLPRIGGMATMPSRMESLRTALPRILPQVERLYVYLDQYDGLPCELAREAKVVPLLPDATRPRLGCGGKLMGLRRESGPCLYFCFDDDIVYPEDHVAYLAAALRKRAHRCVVGMHGSVFAQQPASYIHDKRVLAFNQAQNFDVLVDELGTGTIGFHSSVLDLDPERWHPPNMTDLHLAIEAVRERVPLYCLRRPANRLQPIALVQEDSLFKQALADDSVQTRLLRDAMACYPGAWCMSP
jgi:hypothetical protein